MQVEDSSPNPALPLAGCRVIERSGTVAAAYAGRLLAVMGAEVIMLEPADGSPLREAAPLIPGSSESALFAYLCAGKRSLVCDLTVPEGRELLASKLEKADIFIDDIPVRNRAAMGVDAETIAARFPRLVHLSVLPFGASGPKADWDGIEVNLLHAGGEGFLLPNGLSNELFPDRPPLKIYGHFGSYQGGVSAALCALSAWWSVPNTGGQYIDVSVQDAILSIGAFALQRLGDGSLEHRSTRSFRYGGVFEALDGFVELLTLEDRQWNALTKLLCKPDWSQDPTLEDSLERSRRGSEINQHIRAWMKQHSVGEIVRKAQELGVPAAKYRTPDEVMHGEHERARGLFSPATLQNGQDVNMLVAPFQFRRTPLSGGGSVPALNELAEEQF